MCGLEETVPADEGMNGKLAKPVAVTGVKFTGQVHAGNSIGSIRPALDLFPKHRVYYFIADYHALTTVHDRKRLKRRKRMLAIMTFSFAACECASASCARSGSWA
jgi:tryptophanyl-tRNA synthetase